VGVLWFKANLDSSRASGFIFDLEIHEPYRRKGYARQAMLELEKVARGMGLRQLALHVFAYNDRRGRCTRAWVTVEPKSAERI
jgi:GNAT superfamily N-acetyltransferase